MRRELTDAEHEQALRLLLDVRDHPGQVTNGVAIAAVLRQLDAARDALASIPADVRKACGVAL